MPLTNESTGQDRSDSHFETVCPPRPCPAFLSWQGSQLGLAGLNVAAFGSQGESNEDMGVDKGCHLSETAFHPE